VRARALLRAGPVVGLLAALLVTGCSIDLEIPTVELGVRSWYSSQKILIPYAVYGNGPQYAEYRYEYNTGEGWVVDTERTIRVPDNDRGLIELTAADPDWDHRLTFSALVQSGPGQPLEPVATAERYFRVDTTAPSAETGSLLLTPFEDGTEIAGPPYDETLLLEVLVDHPEFLSSSGSPIRVFFTRDGSVPNGRSEGLERADFIEIWPGGAASYDETYRFIVIDEAGHRSGVRIVTYTAP